MNKLLKFKGNYGLNCKQNHARQLSSNVALIKIFLQPLIINIRCYNVETIGNDTSCNPLTFIRNKIVEE